VELKIKNKKMLVTKFKKPFASRGRFFFPGA
jgi:hypothetical protein